MAKKNPSRRRRKRKQQRAATRPERAINELDSLPTNEVADNLTEQLRKINEDGIALRETLQQDPDGYKKLTLANKKMKRDIEAIFEPAFTSKKKSTKAGAFLAFWVQLEASFYEISQAEPDSRIESQLLLVHKRIHEAMAKGLSKMGEFPEGKNTPEHCANFFNELIEAAKLEIQKHPEKNLNMDEVIKYGFYPTAMKMAFSENPGGKKSPEAQLIIEEYSTEVAYQLYKMGHKDEARIIALGLGKNRIMNDSQEKFYGIMNQITDQKIPKIDKSPDELMFPIEDNPNKPRTQRLIRKKLFISENTPEDINSFLDAAIKHKKSADKKKKLLDSLNKQADFVFGDDWQTKNNLQPREGIIHSEELSIPIDPSRIVYIDEKNVLPEEFMENQELSPEQKTTLTQFCDRLTEEIKKYPSLGIKKGTYRVSPGLTIHLVPPTKKHPSREAGFYALDENSDVIVTESFDLDYNLLVSPDNDRSLILKAYALALIHGQTVRQLSISKQKERSPENQEGEEVERQEQSAIHQLETYLIIDPENKKDKPAESIASIENPKKGTLELVRFVRAHWRELSTSLVMESRINALVDIQENLPPAWQALAPEQQENIETLITAKNSHRFSAQEIVERFCEIDDPTIRQQVAELVQQTIDNIYVDLLNKYTGTEKIDLDEVNQQSLVNLEAYREKYREAVEAAEKEGRALARDEGITLRLPQVSHITEARAEENASIAKFKKDLEEEGLHVEIEYADPGERMRETQTYVPSHMRTDHVREQVKMDKDYKTFKDGTIIVRTNSLINAVTKIISS